MLVYQFALFWLIVMTGGVLSTQLLHSNSNECYLCLSVISSGLACAWAYFMVRPEIGSIYSDHNSSDEEFEDDYGYHHEVNVDDYDYHQSDYEDYD